MIAVQKDETKEVSDWKLFFHPEPPPTIYWTNQFWPLQIETSATAPQRQSTSQPRTVSAQVIPEILLSCREAVYCGLNFK